MSTLTTFILVAALVGVVNGARASTLVVHYRTPESVSFDVNHNTFVVGDHAFAVLVRRTPIDRSVAIWHVYADYRDVPLLRAALKLRPDVVLPSCLGPQPMTRFGIAV